MRRLCCFINKSKRSTFKQNKAGKRTSSRSKKMKQKKKKGTTIPGAFRIGFCETKINYQK